MFHHLESSKIYKSPHERLTFAKTSSTKPEESLLLSSPAAPSSAKDAIFKEANAAGTEQVKVMAIARPAAPSHIMLSWRTSLLSLVLGRKAVLHLTNLHSADHSASILRAMRCQISERKASLLPSTKVACCDRLSSSETDRSFWTADGNARLVVTISIKDPCQ